VLGLSAAVDACLFDLDGVLTQTAKVHGATREKMFAEYLSLDER
jgi:beta-phosphoglucomutase-like phosphatase (HAD superfamily)